MTWPPGSVPRGQITYLCEGEASSALPVLAGEEAELSLEPVEVGGGVDAVAAAAAVAEDRR